MRSAARASILFAAVAALACGNYSDLDVEVIEALPTASQLHLSIPGASGQALCGTSVSDALTNAQTTGGSINTGIEDVLALVDLVRTLPPTKHQTDELIWGPFADANHPAFEDMITMQQTDGGFSYDFEMQPKGAATWTPLITGQFSGGTAATGSGTITLRFDNSTALGVANPGDPNLPLIVTYDLGANPQTIELNAESAGLQLLGFDYQYHLYSDGHGQFVFESSQDAGTITWTVNFQKDGSGMGTAIEQPALGSPITVAECWDASACVDYLDDPNNFTQQPECAANAPCDIGSPSACPDAG